jgi:hypothetical protein
MLSKFDFHATAPYYETNRRKNLLTRLTQEQFLAVLEASEKIVYFGSKDGYVYFPWL